MFGLPPDEIWALPFRMPPGQPHDPLRPYRL